MRRLEKSLAPTLRSYNPRQALTPAGIFCIVSTLVLHYCDYTDMTVQCACLRA